MNTGMCNMIRNDRPVYRDTNKNRTPMVESGSREV